MSIFFASGNISDSQSEQNEQIIKQEKIKPTYNFGDDEEYGHDKKRTVQTEKQKKWNAIKLLCLKITNQLNNQDFEKVWDNFQELLKEVQKAAKVIEKQGKFPTAFLKTLKKVDDDVTAFANSQKKKLLKKNVSTAFNTMRQKLKNKIIPEYEAELKKFLSNEEDYESSQEEQEFQSSEQDESEEDEDDQNRGDWRSDDVMIRRKYFLKKEKKTDKEILEKDPLQLQKPKQVLPNQPKHEEKKKEKFHLSQIHQKKKIQIKSVKEAETKMKNIINTFYKLTNNDQRAEYLDSLNEIVNQSQKYKDFEKMSFLLVDIPIRIEVFRQMKLAYFAKQQWSVIYTHLGIIYNLLKQSQQENLLENVQLFNQNSDSKVKVDNETTIYKSIQAFLIILQSQLRKSFMFINKSEVEYSQRLQDLINLIDFMYKISRDMSFHQNMEKESTQLAFKVLENMYFMSSKFMSKLQVETEQELRFVELSDENVLQQYIAPILKSSNQANVTKTVLYLVFNHAVNQRQKGKQLLIMSSIPQTITQCDYYTQAIYNRCIVQIGINSFFWGKYFEVQQFLSEICSFGYGKTRDQAKDVIREFLAQGFVRGQAEREIPKNKILPYYLHLNVQLIQSLELIASMILETHNTLIEGGKISSKTYRKIYYEYERSHFIAEPLNHRDLIYAASNELRQGNWKQCYDRLVELQMWRQIENVEVAHKNMQQIIKQYSLRCYLLANRKCYRSISLPNLALKFQIQEKCIKKLVSKWIYSRQIQGSINEKGFLILVQKKHSSMQKLCENLYNKLQDIRKAQEHTMEQRFQVQEDEQEAEKDDKDSRLNRRFNLAMSQKLRSILSKRN